MHWNVDEWFQILDNDYKVISVDPANSIVKAQMDGNRYGKESTWTFEDLEQWAQKIPGKRVKTPAWGSYSAKCECGATHVYGIDTQFHSFWCPKYEKP